jgi:ABC-type Fe3+ transport system substrate-binding protein
MRYLIALFLTLHYASADTLVLVSPHWEGIKREFERAFIAEWRAQTGRELQMRWLDVGGTSDIIKYIRSQYRENPKGIDIDILFGGGTDPFLELAKDNLLEPMSVSHSLPETIGGVPLFDPEHRWYAAALSAAGILYNKAVLKRLRLEAPLDWRDLAEPQFYSWVGAADPRKSGSMHLMFELILQAYGWDMGWQTIYQISRNVRSLSPYASQAGKDVVSGEVAAALCNDTYAGEMQRRFGTERLGFVVPTSITSVVGDSIAVLKGAPNSNVARSFLEFVLSEKGQKLWYLKRGVEGGPREFELGKFPLLPSIYSLPHRSSSIFDNPFNWNFEHAYNPVLGGERWQLVNDLFGVFVIDGGAKGEAPPISLAEAEEVLRQKRLSDPLARSKLLNGWAGSVEGKRSPLSLTFFLLLFIGLSFFTIRYFRR